MITETCSCGASITVDDDLATTERESELLADWRANHRQDAARDVLLIDVDDFTHDREGLASLKRASVARAAKGEQ